MIENIETKILEGLAAHPKSMRQAARAAGLPFGTFKYQATKMGLYKANQKREGVDRTKGPELEALRRVLSGEWLNYKAPGSQLKNRMFKAGIKKEICEECGQLPEWNGKPLSLQLDHIDGDHRNNKLENLRIVCPNCHTQTETFSRSTKKKYRSLADVEVADLEDFLNSNPTVGEVIDHFNLNRRNMLDRKKIKQILNVNAEAVAT